MNEEEGNALPVPQKAFLLFSGEADAHTSFFLYEKVVLLLNGEEGATLLLLHQKAFLLFLAKKRA